MTTAQKMKFSIKDFFGKCCQIRSSVPCGFGHIYWANLYWKKLFMLLTSYIIWKQLLEMKYSRKITNRWTLT